MAGWEARPPDGPQSQRPKDASSQALAEWVTHGEQRRGRRADHRHSDRPGCSGGRGPSGILHQELPHPVDTAMLLIALLFVSSTLAADCQPDGDHAATCQTGKCEAVGSSEICTQCRAGGAPIDGFCRPVGSPQAIAAGCTKGDGTALEQTAATCGKCGSEYFLFMGGCYRTGSQPGSEICTAARDGKCTTCKTGGGVFQNPAIDAVLGSECILCSDTTDRGGIMGVENCAACTAPDNSAKGAAKCIRCNAKFVKRADGTACLACGSGCFECSEGNPNQCSACENGKYLKADTHTCVDGAGEACGAGNYADRTTGKCENCKTGSSSGGAVQGVEGCEACSVNTETGKLRCTVCNGSGSKTLVKVAIDGTTTCVAEAECTTGSMNFLSDSKKECILCDNTTSVTPNDKGRLGCKTCTKSNAPPVCSECLEGFFTKDSGATCTACAKNCLMCNDANADQCTKCSPGFFLKSNKTPGECIPCDSTENGGSEGCGVCSNSGTFECTDCKPNYHKQAGGGSAVTCEKFCEDETACEGTAGACEAIVVQDNGDFLHYCSLCGDPNTFPIDGKCVDNAQGNTCANGVCTQCAAGYFLYMGGCYDVTKTPGNLMCKAAGQEGICTEAASDKYFVVPGVTSNTEQSVLACANPLGTLAVGNAYVGVEDCSQCAAPDARSDGGMAVATCTACGEGRKPNKSGTGCAACSIENCRHCRVDDVCEECSSGFSLEGGKCISTGTSGGNRSGLSTGAIAGIAVAVVVVVGGLVGFLCWWFICRGKA
ncbi:VSP [Giardia lamblia P15]|uniref:VSP n=1 Tax=Giardia intestinalis (strain P15) TaxID=658858 RepID=E1F1J9_GIAIA|nr:VSP [Giardia lamblia P15]